MQKPVDPSNLDFGIVPGEAAIVFRVAGRAFRLALENGEIDELPEDDFRVLVGSPDHFVAPDRTAVAEQQGPGFAVRDDHGRTLIERGGKTSEIWRLSEKAWSLGGPQ